MAWSDAARKAALEVRRRNRLLYHVTTTENADRIVRTGIQIQGAPSNWAKAATGKRYGRGEVYAFERKLDAYHWAAKMDWEKNNHKLGSGAISIVRLRRGAQPWKVDKNDPVAQAGELGKWLKSPVPVGPDQVVGARPFTPAMVRSWMRRRR